MNICMQAGSYDEARLMNICMQAGSYDEARLMNNARRQGPLLRLPSNVPPAPPPPRTMHACTHRHAHTSVHACTQPSAPPLPHTHSHIPDPPTHLPPGFLVMRYMCGQQEAQRTRIFEKALDTVATSPFARPVSRWVLAGVGGGARVAALAAAKCRWTVCGYVLLSYPLMVGGGGGGLGGGGEGC